MKILNCMKMEMKLWLLEDVGHVLQKWKKAFNKRFGMNEYGVAYRLSQEQGQVHGGWGRRKGVNTHQIWWHCAGVTGRLKYSLDSCHKL
jgi:hypothetical protein